MKKHNWKPAWKAQKDMTEHYTELFRSSVGELRFERIRAERLLESVREIGEATNDNIAKRLCEMASERYHLDGLIHSRKLFDKE